MREPVGARIAGSSRSRRSSQYLAPLSLIAP